MVSIGSLPASRSRMNVPPKIFSFQRAYMRCLISSVKLFASLGESLLPISSTKGAVVIGSDFYPFVAYPYSCIAPKMQKIFSLVNKTGLKGSAGFRDAFFQLSSVFFVTRRALPTREALDGQTSHAHQLPEYAPPVGAQKSAHDLHEPSQEVVLLLGCLEIAHFQGLVHAYAGFRKRSRWRMNRSANAD